MSAWLIAHNTFREAMRDRVLAGLVIAGLVVLLLTQVVAPIALGEVTRLTVDLGLSSISVLGLMAVLLVGTSMVSKELERRTIFNLLSRPIRRPAYLIGKWLGLCGALWVVAASLGAALGITLLLRGTHGYGGALAEASFLSALELTVVSAIAVLFSSLSTPVLSALYTAGLYLIGQWSYDLRVFSTHSPPPLSGLLRVIADLVPNLPLFNMRTLASEGLATTPLHLGLATLYALVYSACMLCLAAAAFESRDFK